VTSLCVRGGLSGATDAMPALESQSATKIGELAEGNDGSDGWHPGPPTAKLSATDKDWLAGDTVKILRPMPDT